MQRFIFQFYRYYCILLEHFLIRWEGVSRINLYNVLCREMFGLVICKMKAVFKHLVFFF